MITKNGNEIRWTDEYRHKYDSAMAEYLDQCDGEGDWTGSIDWGEHVRRFGKRLLVTDSMGFVDVDKFDNAVEAERRFDNLNRQYGRWLDATEIY